MSMLILRAGLLALSAVALGLGLGSCGKVNDEPLYDSNTNWLTRCVDDGECTGSLRCYCGMCTQPCGQNAECSLLPRAQCAASSESVCGEQASAGGLCVLECTRASDCGDGFGCTAGQCAPQPCASEPLALMTWDEVFQIVNADLSLADTDDQPFLRYIVLTGVSEGSGSAACGGAPLAVKRQALTKLVNSLSLDATLSAPLAIDTGERVYRVDLRNYSWDRPLTTNGFYNDAWEALVANDLYALSFTGDDADDAVLATLTTTPVLLFDSFVATATEPDVYYTLLDIPGVLTNYLAEALGVAGAPAVEAGFIDQSEFVAQYWPTEVREGYVWTISQVGRGPDALFSNPLAEPLGERELVFTLPNGLHAFAFADPSGLRFPGWNVTQDPAEPFGIVQAPRSNWRRHPRTVAVRDEVRDYVLANSSRYRDNELALIRQRFVGPEALSLLLQNNYESFPKRALERLGIDPDAPDPILQSFAEFERDVTLEIAAAELMVTPDDLRDNLELLNPQLAPLGLPGGAIERRVFTLYYRAALCTLSTVNENQPLACP